MLRVIGMLPVIALICIQTSLNFRFKKILGKAKLIFTVGQDFRVTQIIITGVQCTLLKLPVFPVLSSLAFTLAIT